MSEYLDKILNNGVGSHILEPMHRQCRVAVLIPAFNESLEVLLMPLVSLAAQEGVLKKDFEVVFIINNSQSQAAEKTPEFLHNQEALSFLKSLNRLEKFYPAYASDRQKRQILQIKNSGLVVRVIDTSSAGLAPGHNNVGVARNRAGAEICRRFLSIPAGENGIIAMTDCDCRVSSNYIAEIIASFKNPEVNGVGGKWLTEPEAGLPHSRLLEQAVAIHLKRDLSYKIHKKNASDKRLPLEFLKTDSRRAAILINGQNLAVRVRAWLAVGGVPHFGSMEDIVFGYKVAALPGETVYNPNFWICGLIRISERVGMTGFGRRVKAMAESIENFHRGKSTKIFILDKQRTFSLFVRVYNSLQQGSITHGILKRHLEFYGVNVEALNQADLMELADRLNQCLSEEDAVAEHFSRIEELVLTKFYNHLPQMVLEAAK